MNNSKLYFSEKNIKQPINKSTFIKFPYYATATKSGTRL